MAGSSRCTCPLATQAALTVKICGIDPIWKRGGGAIKPQLQCLVTEGSWAISLSLEKRG